MNYYQQKVLSCVFFFQFFTIGMVGLKKSPDKKYLSEELQLNTFVY